MFVYLFIFLGFIKDFGITIESIWMNTNINKIKFIKKAFFDHNKNILISKLPARFLLNDFNNWELDYNIIERISTISGLNSSWFVNEWIEVFIFSFIKKSINFSLYWNVSHNNTQRSKPRRFITRWQKKQRHYYHQNRQPQFKYHGKNL